MKVPTTYVEWIENFEFMKNSPRNDLYIDILEKGSIQFDNQLLMRFLNKLTEMIIYRLTVMINKFINYLKNGVKDYNSFSLEIVNIKKEFKYVLKIANISVIPDENKKILKEQIIEQANTFQDTIEKQTINLDRTGALNSLIKNNPVNKLEVKNEL